jgi:charged multivesicular body protein 1
VREKRRSVTLLQKAAEADVIYADLAAAKSTRDSTRSLAKASRALDVAGRSINLERTLAMANTFVRRSEDFKLAGAALEGVSRDVSLQEGEGAEEEGQAEEVDQLMERLADEAGVELRKDLEEHEAPKEDVKGKQKAAEFEDGLAGRLRALRS